MPFDLELVRARVPGREVVWLESVSSTMIEAAGRPPGTVVVAGEQTAGQGTHGRHWHSEKDTGLYVSIVLGAGVPLESTQAFTLRLGLAVREAVYLETGVACELKWPNDLLAGGRKCAGILLQRGSGALIAGIGVNVNQTDFPGPLAATATSLRLATGREHSRERLLVRILEALDKRLVAAPAQRAKKGIQYAAGPGCR